MEFTEQMLSQILSGALQPLSAKIDERGQKVDQQNLKIDQLSQKIDQQSQKIDQQNLKINQQNLMIDQLNAEVVTVKNQNVTLRAELVAVKNQNVMLRAEINTIKTRRAEFEERLDGLDKAFEGAAPFFRELLEAEDSMLLQPGWQSMRDEDVKENFVRAFEYIKASPELMGQIKPYIEASSVQSVSISLGKKFAQFYRTVFNFDPRMINSRHTYHKTEEKNVMKHAVKVAISYFSRKFAV